MSYIITDDGSQTLFNVQFGEHYHSKHGARQESEHVFLKTGLQFSLDKEPKQSVSILEIGFGTGLNFILSADYCIKHGIDLQYCGVEAFPLENEVIAAIGYDTFVSTDLWSSFMGQYENLLHKEVCLGAGIKLQIAHQKVVDFESEYQFDVIYFDAFAAAYQPEMWSYETLSHVCQFLKPGGVFVTYAITGNLKRSMKALGFTIEKAPGAIGKREMLRAIKA